KFKGQHFVTNQFLASGMFYTLPAVGKEGLDVDQYRSENMTGNKHREALVPRLRRFKPDQTWSLGDRNAVEIINYRCIQFRLTRREVRQARGGQVRQNNPSQLQVHFKFT